ncbi:MAG: cupin domain-containing protein [Proteobacteria bacterium]|nr:cupin domain-containing protein [Pseudomonadota bacterium]
MSFNPQPIRRVVTGRNANGKSCVLYDSDAPLVRDLSRGGKMTDCWVFTESPANIGGKDDRGSGPFVFEPPTHGAHLRIVDSAPPPSAEEVAATLDEASTVAFNAGQTGDRGGETTTRTRNHKTESVDYGIVVSGERTLVLDSGELVMRPGDIVVQVGNFHAWDNNRDHSRMAFVMIGGTFGGKSNE